MTKALKTVGMIAGAVALTAATAGLFAPAGMIFTVGGVATGTIATAAGIVSGLASMGAQALAKPPPARGSVTQMLIAPDVPQPYMMGEGYYAGVLRHDAAYGGEVNDVPNPYRGMVVVYSGGGPVQSISPRVDKVAVTSWYTGWLYTTTQLGATPEAAALVPNYAGLPGWNSTSKLSGQAAILWNLRFDKKGKRFASGVPMLGAYGQWVKAYDPRLDSTFPGGSGSHRLGDETTYTGTENPALHAGTYAYGRYQNGKRTIGCGLTSIDWGVIAAWANVCDANDWSIFGVVYEPANRWENLKDIAAAGGAVPIVSSGGLLSFKYWAPQIALDTITAADIADGQVQYSPLQSWDDRVNTIVPRYTSPDHEWNQIAGEPVSVASMVTEDGEEKRKEWPFNLVKSSDGVQPAQLAAYHLFDGREINPIIIPGMPRLRAYRPGECLTLNLPDYGLELDAIILNRTLDPATMTVTLTLIGETPGKHAIALGQTPATPSIPVPGQTGEDRDDTTSGSGSSAPIEVADDAAMIALNSPVGSLRVGTLVKVTATGKVYSYNGGTAGTIADWTLLATTTGNTAAEITFTPFGNIASTDVQAAIQELDTEKAAASSLGTIASQNANNVSITGGTLGGLTRLQTTGLEGIAAINSTADTRVDLFSTGAGGTIQATNASGAAYGPLVLGGSNISQKIAGATVVLITGAEFDVRTAFRCDGLRIDQAPTAGTITPTHTLTISLNGTDYKIPCVAA